MRRATRSRKPDPVRYSQKKPDPRQGNLFEDAESTPRQHTTEGKIEYARTYVAPTGTGVRRCQWCDTDVERCKAVPCRQRRDR